MTGLLDTLALLIVLISVGDGRLWSPEVPKEDRFLAGKMFVDRACGGVESGGCGKLKKYFWSPSATTPAPETENVTTPTPVPQDPCHMGKCFNWRDYRKQVIYPFINQLQQAQAIGRFVDDEEEGSLFSFSNFKDWYAIQSSPPDGQTISAQTAAILSLKFLAAGLAQTRMARVEALARDGMTWQTAISVPGCLMLAIYVFISIHQLKRMWKARCERNEDLKQERIITRLFLPSAPLEPEEIGQFGQEARQLGRTGQNRLC